MYLAAKVQNKSCHEYWHDNDYGSTDEDGPAARRDNEVPEGQISLRQ